MGLGRVAVIVAMSTEEAVVAEVPVTGVEAETDKAKKAPKEKKVPKEKKPSAAKKPVAHPPYAEVRAPVV